MKRLSIVCVIFMVFSLSISSCLLEGGGSASQTKTVAALKNIYLETFTAEDVSTPTEAIQPPPQSMPATWTPGPSPTWTPSTSQTEEIYLPLATNDTGIQIIVTKTRAVLIPTYIPTVGPPAGATAICKDGTYSYSKSRQGTCSHHGGVNRWLP